MTLARDSSKPQGTYFYDPEGLTYVGGGKFVLAEERFRQVNQFTYVPNTTLTGANVQTVKLGTTVGTTKWHLNQIFGKLQVHNRTTAIAKARDLRLL